MTFPMQFLDWLERNPEGGTQVQREKLRILTDQKLLFISWSVTCASRGCVVVEQLPAGRLHHHFVGLSRLQRAERHLIVVLEHRPGI